MLTDIYGRMSVFNAIYYAWYLFSMIMIPVFLAARMAIVVESFISVHKVPEGVYATMV